MSLLPEQVPGQSYGFFGYRGAMCDRAIRLDNAPMLKERIDRGFMDVDSEMLDGRKVIDYCRKVAPNCAEMMAELVKVAA